MVVARGLSQQVKAFALPQLLHVVAAAAAAAMVAMAAAAAAAAAAKVGAASVDAVTDVELVAAQLHSLLVLVGMHRQWGDLAAGIVAVAVLPVVGI